MDNKDQNCKNDKPILSVNDIELFEAQLAFLNVKVSDPEGDNLVIDFSPPFDKNGRWLTRIGDNRNHDVLVKVSDGINEVSKKVKVNVKKLPGRDLWNYYVNGRFVGEIVDDRSQRENMTLPYSRNIATTLVTDVYMKNDRNLAIEFFCDNLLEAYVNENIQFSLSNPGFSKNIESVGVLKLKKGWNNVRITCYNLRKSFGNPHIMMRPSLSSVVDLMTNNNRTIDSSTLIF